MGAARRFASCWRWVGRLEHRPTPGEDRGAPAAVQHVTEQPLAASHCDAWGSGSLEVMFSSSLKLIVLPIGTGFTAQPRSYGVEACVTGSLVLSPLDGF
jgi:hypothetical protein